MLNPVVAKAVEFTETYKKYEDASIPVREAMCFKVIYPGLLPEFREGDVFVGRCQENHMVHVGSMRWYTMPDVAPDSNIGGKHGGYCFDFGALHRLQLTGEEQKVVEDLDVFWRKHSNMAKVRFHPENIFQYDSGFLNPNDYDKLVKRGLPGICDDVKAMDESEFKKGLLIALETVEDVFRFYIKMAKDKGRGDIVSNMTAILERAPETLAEALQLVWLFELLSHERHVELFQLDVALGDIYVSDIDKGVITQEQAIDYIRAFYEMVNENGDVTVCRLVMGGKGRRNAENADRYIEAALIATQRHNRVTPQVTLRLYDDINPSILKLAYDTISETGTFPLLYNDDAILPGVAEAFDVSLKEAENYYPVGCGEFALAPNSACMLITNWNIPLTIDEGMRACKGDTFDDLYDSVMFFVKDRAEKLGHYVRLVIDIHNKNNAFLMASLLVNDCLSRNKPALDGGARYVGVSIMGHGYTNAADALTALKRVVYTERKYSLGEIIKAIDANFTGYEDIRKALQDAPKYGNDIEDVDNMLRKLWSDIGFEAKKAGKANGLDFHTMASANPGGYYMGTQTGATADGRLNATPFAICNAPAAGNDKNGITAMMNSILKTPVANGGPIVNIKVSREFFTGEREKFEALFSAYWSGGGQQANIAIVNKGELEAAMKNPENYPNLLVRLGGWTARFVDLERYIQEEILTRTLY